MSAWSQRLESLGAAMIPFGPVPPGARQAVEIAGDFGQFPAEYAAIRRYVGVLHLPQRAVLRLAGIDGKDFLHRLLTQDIRGMKAGSTRRSFQLNEKGRIVADLIVHHRDDSAGDLWLDTDAFDVKSLHATLEKRLFGEDVTIEPWTDHSTCFAVIGPASGALLAATGGDPSAIHPGEHQVLTIAGESCMVYRWDDCGVPAYRVWTKTEHAMTLHQSLLDAAGHEPPPEAPEAPPPEVSQSPEVSPSLQAASSDDACGSASAAAFAARRRASLRGRPVGWDAYNTARIEHRTPLCHIDFANDSLPAETGLLDQAVSFSKGCYLGQEIVTRMKSLGHPKRVTCAVRFESDLLPIAGSPIVDPADAHTILGGLTSSALSPLRGNQAMGLAVMRWGRHLSGVKIACFAEGKLVPGEIESLDDKVR